MSSVGSTPKLREIHGRIRSSQSILSDIEYETLIDVSLGLTVNLMAQKNYLSRRGMQSRLNSLYVKLGIEQDQFNCDKHGETFNLRNRAIAVALSRD